MAHVVDVDVAVIKKHQSNIKIKNSGQRSAPTKTTQTWVTHVTLSTVLYTQYVLHLWYVSRYSQTGRFIFKEGDAMNVCNYRSVSILPVSKIYEKEMVCQLENYFEDILSPYISGFRKTHSCETV